jgi:hypothetical protein
VVHRWEEVANLAGEELKQLESTIKEEGLFCVEWCLVVSVHEYCNNFGSMVGTLMCW